MVQQGWEMSENWYNHSPTPLTNTQTYYILKILYQFVPLVATFTHMFFCLLHICKNYYTLSLLSIAKQCLL